MGELVGTLLGDERPEDNLVRFQLRAAIANYYNRQFRAGVDPENVIVNTGTSPIFRNLFQLLSKPGQESTLRRFNAGWSYDVKAMAAHLLAELGP